MNRIEHHDLQLENLALKTPRWSRLFTFWLPWVVLLASLTVTYQLWRNAQAQAERERQAQFHFSVQEIQHEIELRMETYKLLLHGLQGLFASSGNVTRDEFSTYIHTLDLKTRYPGIQALGYAKIAGDRDDIRSSVIYIEPHSTGNQQILGNDIYADPVRRNAMDRARDQNVAALSGKFSLQPNGDLTDRYSFSLFLPIYRRDARLESVDDGRANIIGWVYAQFQARDLLSVLSTAHQSLISLTIYDGAKATNESRLSNTPPVHNTPIQRTKTLSATRQLVIAGHPWTLVASSNPALDVKQGSDKPRLMLIAGSGTSLLLMLLVYMLVHGREHALRIAREMNYELIKSEYRWKYALEGAGEGVWDWNIATGSIFFSQRLKDMLGYSENELDNGYESWKELLHPDDGETTLAALKAYLEGTAAGYSVEGRLRCKDGNWKWVLMRGMVVSHDANGKPSRMIGTYADITERHTKEESLRLASTVFSTANEAMMVTDAARRIITVNPAFTLITGYALNDIIGQHASILSNSVTEPDLQQELQKALKETGRWQGEMTHRKKNGEVFTAWVSIGSVLDEKGNLTNHVNMFADISERKAAEQRMYHLAHYDHLTGLPNRALFTDRLRQGFLAARRNKSHLAVMLIDLDRFKPVNDSFGHNIGDRLLQEVAQQIQGCIRESDTAARIGGDEFVVLLPSITVEQDASLVAEKLLKVLRQPLVLAGNIIHVSASIGYAVYPEHGTTYEAILTNADHAMYQAKKDGGNAAVSFSALTGS